MCMCICISAYVKVRAYVCVCICISPWPLTARPGVPSVNTSSPQLRTGIKPGVVLETVSNINKQLL